MKLLFPAFLVVGLMVTTMTETTASDRKNFAIASESVAVLITRDISTEKKSDGNRNWRPAQPPDMGVHSGVPRCVIEDTRIGAHDVKKGSMVLVITTIPGKATRKLIVPPTFDVELSLNGKRQKTVKNEPFLLHSKDEEHRRWRVKRLSAREYGGVDFGAYVKYDNVQSGSVQAELEHFDFSMPQMTFKNWYNTCQN